MKINSISKTLEIYSNNVAKKDSLSKVKDKKDFLTLSSVAKDYQTAMNAVKSIPDTRDDKVSKIKSAISSRNYAVNAEEISEKILKSNYDIRA